MKLYLHGFALFLLISASALHGEENVQLSEATADAVRIRKDAIQAEIRTLGNHDWAGEYYAGDGLGMNSSVVMAPKEGFVFESHGCLGAADRNCGLVELSGNTLRLAFMFPTGKDRIPELAPELVVVPWGKRRYLVPEAKMVRFCNYINQGSEPRAVEHGLVLLRRGDEKIPVQGFPTIPEQYAGYLLSTPIEAAISAVGSSSLRDSDPDFEVRTTTVVLDAGSAKGLRAGMELQVIQQDLVESVEVTKVTEQSAEGVVTQYGKDNLRPQAGWKLSTRAPWHSHSK